MVELLNEVDTTGCLLHQMLQKMSTICEDVEVAGWNREELFQKDLKKERGYIKVPAILDDGGDAE